MPAPAACGDSIRNGLLFATSSPSSLYCETLIWRKARGNASRLCDAQRDAVSVRKCARRMELKADERQYSWRFRPLASDSGPDRVFNLKNNAMTKLENRCADCGGKFGLVSYHHWGMRFCRKSCKDNFVAKTAKDHARMRRWFGFLTRGTICPR